MALESISSFATHISKPNRDLIHMLYRGAWVWNISCHGDLNVIEVCNICCTEEQEFETYRVLKHWDLNGTEAWNICCTEEQEFKTYRVLKHRYLNWIEVWNICCTEEQESETPLWLHYQAGREICAGWCERENRIQMKALTRLGPVARRIIQAIFRYWGPRGKNKVLHKLFKE